MALAVMSCGHVPLHAMTANLFFVFFYGLFHLHGERAQREPVLNPQQTSHRRRVHESLLDKVMGCSGGRDFVVASSWVILGYVHVDIGCEVWGQGAASDFVLCFGVLALCWEVALVLDGLLDKVMGLGGCFGFGLWDNCIGFGVLLCFRIIVLLFGRCFVFCGI